MNFKTLALATTLAITGFTTGTSAQAMVIGCAQALENRYTGTCYVDGAAYNNASDWKAGMSPTDFTNVAPPVWTAPAAPAPRTTTTYTNVSSGYTLSEATNYCMVRGARVQVQTNRYSGQATGFYECITNGTNYNAGQIPMAR